VDIDSGRTAAYRFAVLSKQNKGSAPAGINNMWSSEYFPIGEIMTQGRAKITANMALKNENPYGNPVWVMLWGT